MGVNIDVHMYIRRIASQAGAFMNGYSGYYYAGWKIELFVNYYVNFGF